MGYYGDDDYGYYTNGVDWTGDGYDDWMEGEVFYYGNNKSQEDDYYGQLEEQRRIEEQKRLTEETVICGECGAIVTINDAIPHREKNFLCTSCFARL